MNASLLSFRRTLESLDGQRLETESHRCGFIVHVKPTGVDFIPESSGMPRQESWRSIENVLHRFGDTGSLRPVTYHDITHNSSYFVTVLRHLNNMREQS
jgi:hypothetical protein